MLKVEIIIASGFVATELAAVVDVLRIANRISGRTISALRIACGAADSAPVSLGGLAVAAERLCADDPLPDILVVAGGAGIEVPGSALHARLRRVMRSGGRVVLLSDATTALMRGCKPGPTVVHWESETVLAECGLREATSTRLFMTVGDLTTCAGMTATYDAILSIIAEQESVLLADDVARVLLLDRRRPGGSEQQQGLSDSSGLPDGPLRHALRLMENAVENPIPISEICRTVGLSSRQLERIFSRNLGFSPFKYYRRLRLRRARLLIESSHLSLTEISLACGFESGSNFSLQFRREYDISPHLLRRRILDWKDVSRSGERDPFSATNTSRPTDFPGKKPVTHSTAMPRIPMTATARHGTVRSELTINQRNC